MKNAEMVVTVFILAVIVNFTIAEKIKNLSLDQSVSQTKIYQIS